MAVSGILSFSKLKIEKVTHKEGKTNFEEVTWAYKNEI